MQAVGACRLVNNPLCMTFCISQFTWDFGFREGFRFSFFFDGATKTADGGIL